MGNAPTLIIVLYESLKVTTLLVSVTVPPSACRTGMGIENAPVAET